MSSAPSTATAASPPRASCCGACRCRRALRAWWSTPARKVTPCPLRKLRRSSANAASAATMSICASASMRCAATARPARATPAPWRSAGRRYRLAPPIPPTRGRGIERRRPARAGLSRTHRQEPRRRGGRVPARQRPRRQRRSRLPARARTVPRRRRACRDGGAGPHSLRRADHACRDRTAFFRSHRSTRRDRVRRRERKLARAKEPAARRHCAFRPADAGRRR